MADPRLFVFLTLAGLHVSMANEPSLQLLPDRILKAVGDGVYVSCTAQVEDPELVTEMSWTGPDGRVIDSSNEKSVSTAEDGTEAKLDLIISPLQEDDVGEYTCTAVYAGNQKLSAKLMVESFMSIDFGDTPTHQTLLIGEEAKIRCTPKAKPAPQVNWFKNLAPLENDETHIIQQDGILITKVTEADEGTYRCRAKVIALGSIQQIDIQVEVNIPPTIDRPPQDIKGKELEPASFECGASGKPAPTYSWVNKDNQPLEGIEGYYVNSETGVLQIDSLKPEHSGKYRCTAKNSAGEDFKSANLQVLTKPKVEQYLNITMQVGSVAEMRCVVTGSPPPQVVFKKESESTAFVPGVNEDDRIIVEQETNEQGQEVGILRITDLARSDDGLYTCTAQSEGGITEVWGHITVEFEPSFEEQGSTTVWSWQKAPVNLTCLATSIPNATIQWYLRNEEIERNDENFQVLSLGPLGVLLVNPVSSSYFGEYTCEATNTLGTTTLDMELKEAHAPGPITSAKVEKKTATTITWSLQDPNDDGGLPIHSYVVEYRIIDDTWENGVRLVWSKGSSYTIDNLEPQMTYVFRFAARSKAGDGQWGGENDVEMPRHAPPEEPLIFDVGSDVKEIPYSSRYNLQWKVPLANGKMIDYFQIIYYQVRKEAGKWEPAGDKMTEQVEHPGTTTYTIEGLDSNSHYKIELRAHNEIGFSTPAEAVIKTANGTDVDTSTEQKGIGVGIIIAVIIIVIIIVAVVVDVTCFFTRNTGLTATIAGKRSSKDKDKEAMLEDGKNASDDKHEGNGQMKTQEELKPEQQDSDKKVKESSEPTETTPMIQGRAPHGSREGAHQNPQEPLLQQNQHPEMAISKNSVLAEDRRRHSESHAFLRPAHHNSSELLLESVPGHEISQFNKPIIVDFIKKSKKEQNVNLFSAIRPNDSKTSCVGNSVKNFRSTPILDTSYSEDSLYAKPNDDHIHLSALSPHKAQPPPLPKRNPSTSLSHKSRSQEVLSDTLQHSAPDYSPYDFQRRHDYPFLHKTPVVQPITISMEDFTYRRSRSPHHRFPSREELNRPITSRHISASKEALDQGSSKKVNEAYMKTRSREALDQIIPRPYHISRSREALDQAIPGISYLSRSSEARDQAIPGPTNSSRRKEALDEAISGSSYLSRSRELDQALLGSSYLSRSKEALNQAISGPLYFSGSREAIDQTITDPSYLSGSKKIVNNDPNISSLGGEVEPKVESLQKFSIPPPKPPSISSNSTLYQPTNAAQKHVETRTAYKIAPYDDPGGPLSALSQGPGPPPKGKGGNVFLSPKTQLPDKDSSKPYRKGSSIHPLKVPTTPVSRPSFPPPPTPSLFSPPQGEEKKNPMKTVTKVYFREPPKQPNHSLSMDHLDGPLNTLQLHSQPSFSPTPAITTAKSLNSLSDFSDSSLRSYGQPTLL